MPELNMDNLEKNLGLNEYDTAIVTPKSEIDTFMETVPGIDEDAIINQNIERANRVLDRIEDEMDRGNFNARMVEVFSKLIDSVTTAASQIQSSSYNNDYLVLKQKLAELKEMEVKHKVKGLIKGNTQIDTQQNIIVTDRESILEIIKGNKNKDIELEG